jgi:hypothetical protein
MASPVARTGSAAAAAVCPKLETYREGRRRREEGRRREGREKEGGGRREEEGG